MVDIKAPSLLNTPLPSASKRAVRMPLTAAREAKSLLDLLYDGLYVVFMLKNGQRPSQAGSFREHIRSFLLEFERGAATLNAPAEDVFLNKFAFCALVDETMLMTPSAARDEWERRPLQLELFGEQLAGERFFEHLEKLRNERPARVQVLEVFHMCLLLGFHGQYVLEGSEKLKYVTGRLGDEIAHLKGKRASFAPHWEAPDRITHTLRNEVPLWVIASVFACLALLAYVGLQWGLTRQTHAELAAHSKVIDLPRQVANVTITLP
jgi:type VI secretion system protein ImpK